MKILIFLKEYFIKIPKSRLCKDHTRSLLEQNCTYTLSLYINNTVISRYTNKDYEKLININSSPKRNIIGIKSRKNTQYDEILFFHKSNFQKFDTEDIRLSMEIESNNLDNIFLLTKKTYLSSIEKLLLNNSNRLIPHLESISVTAMQSNIIELPFTGKSTILIIDISHHEIDIIKNVELFLIIIKIKIIIM